MCGHCTERAALAERLVAIPHAVIGTDPLLLAVHLQETHDWRGALVTASRPDDLVTAIVALCRAWSERSATDAPTPRLRDVLGPAGHARLVDWLAALDMPEAWAWLRDVEAPVLPSLTMEQAKEEIDAYLAGWLGVRIDPARAWDDATLHERLPRVSAALDLLCREQPGDDRLVVLALSSPGATSPFSAVDLWLQRRATQAVIAHHGIAFVLPLLGRWRSGALLAAVLRGDLDRDALHALQDALARRSDDGTEGARDLRIAVARMLAD